jgi:hypothetical protein
MKTSHSHLIALAISLAFSAGAMAQSVSKAEYKSGKDAASAEYKVAKEACSSLAGNAKDICVLQAKGAEKVSVAELLAKYEPTPKHHYQLRTARADADYKVAKERCDDLSGNPKDVCVKEAKALQATVTADAKLQLKARDANATADKKTSEAHIQANSQVSSAVQDAQLAKLNAQYQVEKEKCDSYAGASKDQCMKQVNVRFGK